MKVIDPGHKYELASLDGDLLQVLQFVKRCQPPEKYRGNLDAYPGTTIQEVLRALIERCQYVNGQIRSGWTEATITHLRRAILELETRAASRHGRKILPRFDIENEPTCSICGHIQCNEQCAAPAESERKSETK